MEQLGTILRVVCLGVCACGLGIGVLVAVFLGFTGRGLMDAVKDILGVGEHDEDKIIDDAMTSIQQNRARVRNKRDQIVGDGGIPDFDAAVAKFAQQGDNSDDSFSAQSSERPPNIGGLGSGQRFGERRDGLRGKRPSRDDDYEIFDDGDFFEG